MTANERLVEIIQFLETNHPDVAINNLNDKLQSEKVILSAIKEFSKFNYDQMHKFFTRDIEGVMFATENVELKEIKTPIDLHRAIEYLNQAYDQRYNVMQKSIPLKLPKDIFTPPKEVRDISRKNIEAFLKDSYQVNNEKELYELKPEKQKQVIYDIYRTFTGCVPLKQNMGAICFSVPQYPELKLRYNGLPDFENSTNLFSHIRDMREINKNTQIALKQITPQRLKELKKMTQDQKKQKDNDQQLEQ